MKKLFVSSLILAAIIALLGSCKDDENPKQDSSVTYDGKEYSLTKAFAALDDIEIEDDGTWYVWSLLLSDNGISYDDDEEELKGSGDLIYAELWTLDDDSKLPVGTFVFPEAGGNFIEEGGLYLGYDLEEEEGEEDLDDIKSASVTISKSGSTYTISFSFTLLNDKVITGKYVGTVKDLTEV